MDFTFKMNKAHSLRLMCAASSLVLLAFIANPTAHAQSSGETAIIELKPQTQNNQSQQSTTQPNTGQQTPQQATDQNNKQPETTGSIKAAPEQIKTEQIKTEQIKTEQTKPAQSGPEKTEPGKNEPNKTNQAQNSPQQTDPQNTGSVSGAQDNNAQNKNAQNSQQQQPAAQQQAQGQSNQNAGQQNPAQKPEQKPKDVDQTQKTRDTKETKASEPTSEKKLTLASWGGAYAAAQDVTFLGPFTESEKIKTSLEKHDHNFDSIKDRISSQDGHWDLVDLSQGMLEQACSAGLLENIDPSSLASGPNGPAQSDFIEGSLKSCGVGTMVWSSTILYNTRSFEKKKVPQTVKDFFSVKNFKGQRALPKQPEYVLELALLADGVAPSEIYSLLETEAGIERAFKRLDTIKKNITWISEPTEALKLLKDNKVVMGVAYTGQVFQAIAKDKNPLAIIWDGQIYNINYLAVPKTSKNKAEALKFVSYATTAERLAKQSSWFPYGPTRRSAISLIGKHPEAGIEVSRFIPTQEGRMKTALQQNQVWWQTHRADMQDRFQKWLNGEEYIKRPQPAPLPADQQNNTQQNNSAQNTTTQPDPNGQPTQRP